VSLELKIIITCKIFSKFFIKFQHSTREILNMRQILLLFTLLILIFIPSCSSDKEMVKDVDLNAGTELYHFYYVIEGDTEKLIAEPIKDKNIKTLKTALEVITGKLSQKYNVKFELESLTIIDSRDKDYRIALINISDSADIMTGKYFQGSTGGMFTQSNILMTILQPQAAGFLDGCIIHLNGRPIVEMDHVNFNGIMNPGAYEYKARQVLKK